MVMYTSFAVFILLALSLVVVSGYSLGAALLLVGSATLLWKRPKLALKKDDYWLISALVLYFIVSVGNTLYHADPLREYDSPLRFLLVIPVLLLLLAYPAKPAALWGGLAFGAISGGLFVSWQHLVLGIARAGGNANAIQYSNVCVLLGLLCLAGVAWATQQQRKIFWTGLLLLGVFMGLFGSLMSETRGSWIAVPCCAVIMAAHYGGVHGKRYWYIGLFTLLALIGALYAVPQSQVAARSELAIHETSSYFQTYGAHNTETSVGLRLEMWSTALTMAPEHLWLGWGQDGYMNNKLALIQAGKIAPSIAQFSNVHNEYIDALVKHGLLGLGALLSMYLGMLRLFARKLKHNRADCKPYALAGVFLMTSYLAFGLTTTFMTVNNGVMMLAFLSVILWSSARAPERLPAGQ